ncbi:hypothetical protein PISMIDRAFT_19349 [Pisolithus microcarpus 441]|uniref:Uncharacterized protein n=1 Tax=Pisolithus microcarpus 441 TaxID=765257 RepID=A0A0C9YCV1_9AGAM|nr:hypothetical protein PISMIDRAFT_19349 [Pisolithus microcarpus 441]
MQDSLFSWGSHPQPYLSLGFWDFKDGFKLVNPKGDTQRMAMIFMKDYPVYIILCAPASASNPFY